MKTNGLLKSIVVFCGSELGNNSAYAQAAMELGQLLAEHKIRLIYGGGNRGLMGVIASTVLKNFGQVIGISPEIFHHENPDFKVTEYHCVPHIHDRKKMMYDLADAAIVLPGGWGSIEEFSEFFAWTTVGIHKKPLCFLNIKGFFNHQLRQFAHMQLEGFIKAATLSMFKVAENPVEALEMSSNCCIDFKVQELLNKVDLTLGDIRSVESHIPLFMSAAMRLSLQTFNGSKKTAQQILDEYEFRIQTV